MEPGLHPQTTTIDGTALRYTLSIPEGLAPGAPLVLCLHYAGHGMQEWYGRGLLATLVEPVLRPLEAVMVAPDCLPGLRWTDPAVEALVMKLLDAVAGQFESDLRRVVVIGYSMGGMGAWQYAANHPTRFSAAIPMAGHPAEALPTIPVYIVHSRSDELVPIGPDEAAAAALAAAGQEVVFEALTRPTHYAVAAHAQGLVGVVSWLERMWAKAP